jgi:hypothetical protein
MALPSDNKRAKERYRVNIPAVIVSEGAFLTGILENLSASGALLTHPTGDLDVGARGTIRLMSLNESLHTTGKDSLELPGEIVRKELGGFAVHFGGDHAELERLLTRALGRKFIEPS